MKENGGHKSGIVTMKAFGFCHVTGRRENEEFSCLRFIHG